MIVVILSNEKSLVTDSHYRESKALLHCIYLPCSFSQLEFTYSLFFINVFDMMVLKDEALDVGPYKLILDHWQMQTMSFNFSFFIKNINFIPSTLLKILL